MKRRAWKWLLGLLGSMALATGAVVLDAHRRASATFAHHESVFAGKLSRIQSRTTSRPPFGGEALPENGCGFYIQAFGALEALPAEITEAIPEVEMVLEEGELPDDHLLHSIFSAQAAPLALLERAARCGVIDPKYDYSQGPSLVLEMSGGSISGIRFLMGLLAHQYRTGQAGESLRTAALALAIGQDTARQGPTISLLIQSAGEIIVCDQVRRLLREGHGFSATDLEQFARNLDGLEGHRPRIAEFWDVEDLSMRVTLMHEDWNLIRAQFSGKRDIVPTWRCLYSRRITRAQALNVWEEYTMKLERVHSLPLPRQIKEFRRIEGEFEGHPNPLVGVVIGFQGRILRREAANLMGRTLLRVATAIAWYEVEKGQAPVHLKDLVPRYLPAVPVCPMTGLPLGYRSGTLWSPGVNGVDDGGTPGKEDDLEAEDGDVVWTVNRK